MSFEERLALLVDRVRIPAKRGQRSEGCRAIIPVDAGPVVKRFIGL
jgi:hypothetical protein